MASATVAVTSPRPNSTREFNRKFAVGMAVALFAVNFAGFVPTFFLRPFFDVPEVPLYLYLHGAVGTAWFLLFASRRPRHVPIERYRPRDRLLPARKLASGVSNRSIGPRL